MDYLVLSFFIGLLGFVNICSKIFVIFFSFFVWCIGIKEKCWVVFSFLLLVDNIYWLNFWFLFWGYVKFVCCCCYGGFIILLLYIVVVFCVVMFVCVILVFIMY